MKPLSRKTAYTLDLLIFAGSIAAAVIAYARLGWPGLVAVIIALVLIGGLVMYLSFFLPVGRQRFKQTTTRRSKIYEVLANLFAGHDLEGVKAIVDECQIKSGERILDIASGTGYAAVGILSLIPDSFIVGLDLSVNMLLRIREKAAREDRGRIYLNLGDAEELPYKDSSFAVVLSIFHLNLTSNRQGAIAEMARVARNGGRVAIQVPRAFFPYMRGAGWYAEKLTELGLARVKIRRNSLLCSLITAHKP